jgi:predicted nucleic acid-binding protein
MENTQKSTLDILQEVSSEETSPYYFDETTGLDLKPETKEEEETTTDEVSETTESSQEYTMGDEDHLSFINENDDDDYELPTLDPSLAENPVLLKRAQEYEKGVKKLINRVKEKEAERGNLQNLAEWNKVLSDPETVAPSLKHLVKNLASMYNLDVYDLYLGTVNDSTDDVSFVSEDYSTSSQADIDKLVEAKVNERLKAYEEDLGYVQTKERKGTNRSSPE